MYILEEHPVSCQIRRETLRLKDGGELWRQTQWALQYNEREVNTLWSTDDKLVMLKTDVIIKCAFMEMHLKSQKHLIKNLFTHIHRVWKWTKMSKIGLDGVYVSFSGRICFDKFLLYKETEFAIPAFFETNFNFLQGFQHRCLKLIMKSPLSKFVNEWELQIFFLTWWPYVQTKWSIGT